MRALPLAFLCLSVFAVAPAAAQTGFYLPTAPTSYGQDEFRAADGTSCRSSMDGTKRVEVGTYASGGRNPIETGYAYGYGYQPYPETPMGGNAGVYGRFTMSLDAHPDRMDCNKLFELEMEKRRLEVEVMKRSLNVADHQLDELREQRRSRSYMSGAVDERSKHKPSNKSGSGKARTAAEADVKETGTTKSHSQANADKSRRNAPL